MAERRSSQDRSDYRTRNSRDYNRRSYTRDDARYASRTRQRSSRDTQARNRSAASRPSSSRRPRTSSYRTTRSSSSLSLPSLEGLTLSRLIAIAAVIVILLVAIAVAVSTCTKPASTTASQTASVASAEAAASASAESASAEAATDEAVSAEAEAASETADASSAAAQASAEAPSIPIVNAKPGDVTYVVSSAAKLKYRDADFAVNPARTDWNYDTTNGHKTMYLTFDDGPSANTERVLDILDQYNCKATFFVTGQNPDYFPWIKEAYDRGHTIGLHSYSHDYESCYSSPEAFWNEFDQIGQVVKDQIGYVPCFIRFPGGASNTVSADYSQGIMTELANQVHERGYQYYDWSLSCGDGSVHTADELVYYGCEPTEEENVIYLAHDGAAKETTVEALPAIIEYYQSQGYTFEAIDRDTMVYQHGISN